MHDRAAPYWRREARCYDPSPIDNCGSARRLRAAWCVAPQPRMSGCRDGRPRHRAALLHRIWRPWRQVIRIFRHYIPKWLLIMGTIEAVILFAAVYLGFSVRVLEFNPSDKLLVGELWSRGLVYALVMVALMTSVGLYQRSTRDSIESVMFRLAVAFALGLALFSSLLTLFPALSIGRQGWEKLEKGSTS